VRILAAGVCGSDIDITTGRDPRVPLPLIPGHEVVGEVIATTPGKRDVVGALIREGTRVVFNRGLTCGRCLFCAVKQTPALCPYRETYGITLSCAAWPHLNGGYGEVIYVRPESEVFTLPEEAEPVGVVAATCSGATAAHAVELADVDPGDVVAVIGPGPLGLYAAALAREHGAREVVMVGTGRRPQPLRLAEAGGCIPVDLLQTDRADRQSLVRGLTHGRGADAVLDCAGTRDSLDEALALVGAGGTVAFPGVAAPMERLAIDPYHLSRHQIRLQGVWVSEPRHLWQALQVASSMRYPLDALVTHVLPWREANAALGLVRDREAIKVVLIPD
jgi:threonine dehydrogenase-like Zn-dependent dehydrogenase